VTSDASSSDGLWTVPPEDEAAAAELARRKELLKAAVRAVAPAYDVHEPLAYRLIDTTLLVLDEDGRPLNVRQAMDVMVAKHPYLVGARPVPPSEREPPPRPMPADRRRRIENAGQWQRAVSRLRR
jgi:hypothetical protein